MKIYKHLKEIPFIPRGILTIGFFDGFHLGHQKIFEKMSFLQEQESLSQKSQKIVLTFKKHPLKVLYPQKAPLLISSFDFKVQALQKENIHAVFLPPFTLDFSQIPPLDFLNQLLSYFGFLKIVVGSNFKFGKDNQGDIQTLQNFAQQHQNCEVYAVPQVFYQEDRVSSSYIRSLISQGDLEKVSLLLGRPFFMQGQVQHGQKIGRQIGFPTANIALCNLEHHVIPPFGSYIGQVKLHQKKYPAFLYLGTRKLQEDFLTPFLEVSLFDFHGQLYNQDLKVDFLKLIRLPLQFKNKEELLAQLILDKEKALQFFKHNHHL